MQRIRNKLNNFFFRIVEPSPRGTLYCMAGAVITSYVVNCAILFASSFFYIMAATGVIVSIFLFNLYEKSCQKLDNFEIAFGDVMKSYASFFLILKPDSTSVCTDKSFFAFFKPRRQQREVNTLFQSNILSLDDTEYLRQSIATGKAFFKVFEVQDEFKDRLSVLKAYTIANPAPHEKDAPELYIVIIGEYPSPKISDHLNLFDAAKIPAALVNNGKISVYNELAKKHINKGDAIASLSQDMKYLSEGLKYSISRFKLPDSNSEEIIVFVPDNPSYEVEIIKVSELSTIPTMILDKDFNIIKTNNSLLNLMHFDHDDIVNFQEIISHEDQEIISKMFADRKNGVLSNAHEINIPKYHKVVLYSIDSVVSSQSKELFICKLFDLTKYKTLEMNFIHSQKMQAIGQLAGAIAHDFNNLLTAILGFSDLLLLRHSPGDKSFNELMQIKQNANRAANLVRQLLAFSRKQVLIPKIIDVGHIMAELSNLLNRLLGGKVTMEIEYAKNLELVKVDEGQLEQAIINLAVNARDAMPEGGKLLIRTSNVVIDEKFKEKDYYSPVGDEVITPGPYVLIEVSDTGAGIKKDIVQKIFEPFFSTKDTYSGTGLGLSTVYGIVKQTEGYIRFTTTEGKGTTFFVFLKAVQEGEDNSSENTTDTELMESLLMKDHTYKGKILIVEDEVPVRLFGVHALMNKGYEVIEAESGEAALTILETEGKNISVVITDVIMPGMTGPQMAEKIAKKYPHIKFIFTSGYAEDAISYLSDNDHHFLAKPFTLNDLASKVKEVISGE